MTPTTDNPFVSGIHRARTRTQALRVARAEARQAGFRVVDVSQVTEQRDGTWLVELRVAAR